MNIFRKGAIDMVINDDFDFELSREETDSLLNVLRNPSGELLQRRNDFFAKGNKIEIHQGENGEKIAYVDGLDLSFLENSEDKKINNDEDIIKEVKMHEEFLAIELNYNDILTELIEAEFAEKIDAYNTIKSKITINNKNSFYDLTVSNSSIAA